MASALELEFLQDALAIGFEQTAGGGEFDILGAALEQHRADQGLELLDLMRQCRLCHVQPLGRAREAAGVRDGEKIAEMT